MRSLNISLDYCQGQDTVFALQELIANAVDANCGIEQPKIKFPGRCFTISDSGCGLQNADFVLGETTSDAKTIGSFGVGMLDAVAILMREKADLTCRSRGSQFTFKIVNNVIHLDERSLPVSNHVYGTTWTINNVTLSSAAVQELKSRFLIFNCSDEPFIRVIADGLEVYVPTRERPNGQLYVNGLRMRGVKPLAFHYNFTDQHTGKFGREHQVTDEVFKLELKRTIANVYNRYKDRFFDALVQVRERGIDVSRCDERNWFFMKELFDMTVRPPTTTSYTHPPPQRRVTAPRKAKPLPIGETQQVQKQQAKKQQAKKQQAKKQVVTPTRALVDCASVDQQQIEDISKSFKSMILFGTDIPASTKKRNKTVTITRHPSALHVAMAMHATRYCSDVLTLFVDQNAANALKPVLPNSVTFSVSAPRAEVPQVYKCPKTDAKLWNIYENYRVQEATVQVVKERIEQWLAGINNTLRLGGSLKKGVATRHSDIDIVVSVEARDWEKAEKAMRAHADASPYKGGLYAMVKCPVAGKVDVMLTREQNPIVSVKVLEEELEWFESTSKRYDVLKPAVVNVKLWVKQNSLVMKGAAVESLVAEACDRCSSCNDVTLSNVVAKAVEILRAGKQVIRAKCRPRDDLMAKTTNEQWDAIRKAAAASTST